MTATAAAMPANTTPASRTIEPKVNCVPDSVVKRYVLMTSAAGCIPVPLLDVAAIMGCQLMMLKDLSQHYGIKFSEHRVKNILGSLVGSFGAAHLLTPLLASAIKLIPVVGTAAGWLAMPGAAAASTYGVGKVFVQHFASGGTFLDFKPENTRAFYEQQFREAQKRADDKEKAVS